MGQGDSSIPSHRWLDGLEEQRQRTDIHYRSLQGDGAFNWRFVFSFQCLAAEELCILPHKARDTAGCGCRGGGTQGTKVTPPFSPQEHFWSLDPTVRKVPPKLILQVWDNDKFSADDFLGETPSPRSVSPQQRGGHPQVTPTRDREHPQVTQSTHG